AVPASLREPVERWTGADLSHVRLDTRTDPRRIAGADGRIAAASGDTVYTGLAGRLGGTRFGRQVLVHELVHTAQFGEHGVAAPHVSRAAPLALGFCGGSAKAKDAFAVLRSGRPLSAGEASAVLDAYEGLGPADRDRIVTEFHQVGDSGSGIRRLLDGVDPAQLERRRALVSDMQERVQRLAVEATAGKTLAQLGAIEGAEMKKQAETQALADAQAEALKKGVAPPKAVGAGDVAKAHEKETKKSSPVTAAAKNAWNDLGKGSAAQQAWNARAAAVIAKVVAGCAKVAPQLKITAANLKWAPEEVAQAGSNVYAFAGDPISFGMMFVETAESNPDYVVRTVVHEIAGHPGFGDRFKSSEAIIYAEAHKAEPSLGSPWDTEEEVNSFGYIGTEIYAALREVPFDRPLSASDQQKGLISAIDPESNIDNKIGLVKLKFTPATGTAIVQGLFERFRVDPRVSAAALSLFVKIVEKHFGKVLKK
uniref:eCIS core domain-containing protein n=1 Tax=Microbacterium sp. TaxID=51671 RepID=UPI003221A3DC